MYSFKIERLEEIKKQNLSKMARDIGITYVYLTGIIHNKKNCKKTVAYCITKYINKSKEINYYFNEL